MRIDDKNKKDIPNIEKFKEYLSYDPNIGSFNWIKSTRIIDMVGKEAGSESDQGYIIICIHGKKYRAHRLAWFYIQGEWPDKDIDHINRVRNDNRFINLRVSNRSSNNANGKMRKNNTSGFRGVSYSKENNYYHAYINHDSKRKNIGYFKDPIEAAKAYDNHDLEIIE